MINVKTKNWLRWTAAGAFGLMLGLNIMAGLDFDTDGTWSGVTLRSLSVQAQSFPEIPDQPGIHCRCHNDGVCYGGNQFSFRKNCNYSNTGTANCNDHSSNCPG